jgi:hypothetical protein
MQRLTGMRLALTAAAFAWLWGCGYIGEPMPPALKIPQAVQDLRVVQYGDRLVVDFTIPSLTTERLTIKELGPVELRVGPGGTPFDVNRWVAAAKEIPVNFDMPGAVQKEVPAGEWTGKEVVVGVRLSNTRGRKSPWSNLVSVQVQSPVPAPVAVKAEPTAAGVKLTWSGVAPSFRVFRKGPSEQKPSVLGESGKPEYLDASAQFDRTYEYIVQALRDKAESEVSAPVSVTPKDTFPPAPPAGLTVVTGVSTIELAWERNTEPDLRGYRVYRASDNGDFSRIAEFVDVPAYSDHKFESGKRYRYAVTAIDLVGNESARSALVDTIAP